METRKIELVEVNKQLAQVKGQYENAKALLEKNRQRKEIETSIENLKQKYNERTRCLAKKQVRNLKSSWHSGYRGIRKRRTRAEFRRS